jgi:hypothetical protein
MMDSWRVGEPQLQRQLALQRMFRLQFGSRLVSEVFRCGDYLELQSEYWFLARQYQPQNPS